MRSRAPRGVTPIPPGPGQESVWDYPRPPVLELSSRPVEVRWGDVLVAASRGAWRVLETSHPPAFYLPARDVVDGRLVLSRKGSTTCEWKGRATYWDVITPDGEVLPGAGWSYHDPSPRFRPIAGHVSFMPGMLVCSVAGERVRPQAGGFYGGWITADVVGPFKGEPGTWGW